MQHRDIPREKQLMQRPVHPERLLALGFLALIALGAVLLALPIASANGVSIGPGPAVFTAASAVCVTGLIVVDTGTAFSLFGQVTVLVLIQLGGLGFMIFATLIMAALGRRITLRSRLVIRESMNAATLSGLVRLTGWYGLAALVIEAAGAALLALRFVPRFGWGRGLYFSLFHAVSAFCNAGFDLFGGFSSLTSFAQDPLVLLSVSALILLGGLGFSVLLELPGARFRWRMLSLHARMTLAVSGGLLFGGTLAIALLEWANPETLGALQGTPPRLLNAFFQAVTMRTAGFNSVDLAGMGDASKIICILMMFVGASPASTGGGVKTTTIAVLLLAISSEIRGREDVTLWRRRLPEGLMRRALTITGIAALTLLFATFAVTLAEGSRVPFLELLFETTSACATVGVSSIGTANLSKLSRLMLIPMMYLGRVGPLTLALALGKGPHRRPERIRYPEEQVSVG